MQVQLQPIHVQALRAERHIPQVLQQHPGVPEVHIQLLPDQPTVDRLLPVVHHLTDQALPEAVPTQAEAAQEAHLQVRTQVEVAVVAEVPPGVREDAGK